MALKRLRAELARLREENAALRGVAREVDEESAKILDRINKAIGVLGRHYEDARDITDVSVRQGRTQLCLEFGDILKPGLMAEFREIFREKYGRYPEEDLSEAETEPEPGAETDIEDEPEPGAEPDIGDDF